MTPHGNVDSWGAVYRDVPVLVLGATGFIGRWVARRLTEEGAILTLGVRNRVAMERLQQPWRIEGRIVEVDLEGPGSARELVGAVRPSVVFNLAGYGVDRSETDADLSRRLNAGVVEELVSVLRERDSSDGWCGLRLVHAGSALEYGEASGDLAEDSEPVPTTLYGAMKLAGTRIIARATAGSLRAVTARLFTVYGPGEHPGRLLPTLMEARDTEEGVIPLTTGEQYRDFTHVEDVVEGLLRLGAHAGPSPGTVNLATGTLHQVRDFVREAARILPIPSHRLGFGILPGRSDDMQHLPVRIVRLQTLLGWQPRTDIATGIRRTGMFLRDLAPHSPAKRDRDGI